MTMMHKQRGRRLCTALALCGFISACTDVDFGSDGRDSSAETGLEFRVAPPPQTRAVDRSQIAATVLINSEPVSSIGPDSEFPVPVTGQYTRGDVLEVVVNWRRISDQLLIWRFSRSVSVTGDTEIQINEDDYRSQGQDFDADSDGASNLDELECGSDPTSSDSVPGNCDNDMGGGDTGGGDTGGGDMSVEIKRLDAGVAPPVIDGRYANPGGTTSDSPWAGATFNDVSNGRLSIDNLMLQEGSGPLTENPAYRWYALHDDVNLYVFVEGKMNGVPIPFDSDRPWDDDNLELFIDGDGSGGNFYDDVNDYQVHLPLSNGGNENTDSGRVIAGLNAAGGNVPAGLRLGTCFCVPVATWELSVPLASVDILPGRIFGIELQIDEDNDGGGRDAKFGWSNPSISDLNVQNSDLAFQQPQFFGRALLEQ